MPGFYKPEELAEMLQVENKTIHELVRTGLLRAYRIGGELRISGQDLATYLESAVEQVTTTSPETPLPTHRAPTNQSADHARECPTFGGQSTFTYTGSVTTGTIIWPSKKATYKLKFDANQWALLLSTFQGKEVRAGLNFSTPEPGSFGAWIKEHWNTKMGPAAYVGGILIAEGYAERSRPGWIKIFARPQEERLLGSF